VHGVGTDKTALAANVDKSGTAEGLPELRGAPRGAIQPGGMKGPTCGLSQQAAEAGGSLTLEALGWVRAASTTTGRVGTARRPGSGKQDGEVYECRNQWWNPLKSGSGSNLAALSIPRFDGHLR
jgi:hypothetical protein